MTDPGTEGRDYLNEAAAELRKARASNENRLRAVDTMHSEQQAEKRELLIAKVNDRRMEIAAAFTRLAECQAAMLDAALMPDLLPVAPADPQSRSEP